MTTLADIQSGSLGYRWVLLIEGCEFALCSRNPSTVASYLSAASWDWTDAIDGLMVLGGWEQSLDPWEPSVQVGRLSFAVSKGIRSSTAAESDAFAELMFGQGNGVETYLDAALDCNDTTVTVKSTSAFAASGTIHIGAEAIGYTAKTATTFTGCVRGKYAPFKADTEASQRFGQAHRIASVGDNVIIPPKVTSKQREWQGRRVGLYMLSDKATSWSDRRLVWAGRIADRRDGTNGLAYLECVDIKAQLKECQVLRHQFQGRIRQGIYLQSGWKFDASDTKAGTTKTANTLRVSSSPAAGEIQSGRYSLEELADVLNDWFASERSASRLGLGWAWLPAMSTPDGWRSKFSWTNASSTDSNAVKFKAPRLVAEFMGLLSGTVNTSDNRRQFADAWDDEVSYELLSPDEPLVNVITPYEPYELEVEDIRGDLFDNRPFLPDLNMTLSTAEEWVVLQLNEGPMLLFSVSSESATEVSFFGGFPSAALDRLAGATWERTRNDKVTYSEGIDLNVRQVAIISGRQFRVLTQLIASTGTAGYNHATYDALPAQLSAGVPWELLGDGWADHYAPFDSGQAFRDTYVIEKPTGLMSIVGSGLVARVAQIVWKDEGLRVVSWGTPTEARALHNFTESNKAIASDAKDPQRVSANQTDAFLVNNVRINYGRGDNAGTLTIIDPASQDTYGQFGKEVDLPSTGHYGNVSDIAADLEAMVPMFSRPLHIINRTIDPTYYEDVTPGDFVTISDNFARDPATGTRGLSSKPGLVTRTSFDWGGFDDTGKREAHGSVDILVLPLSNIGAYSPCAELDETAPGGGYDGVDTITVKLHEHTESSETTDPDWFAEDESVRIVEIDPADPATPLTWVRTVNAINGADLVLNGAVLAGFDSTKRYRVISDVYSNATASQTPDVYQADDVDGMIEDLAGAYVYGTDVTQAGTWTDDDGDEQVALYSEYSFGDGAPLDTGYEKDWARLANNMVHYRTAVILPTLTRSVMSSTVTVKRILGVYPLNLHPGALMLGERPLRIRPWFRSNDGTSVTISVSLCTRPPTGTSMEMGDADSPDYALGGSCETLTWSTSSTTWAAGSAQAFTGATVDQVTGRAYLVIESSSTKLETRGLPLVWQDAYDEDA